MAIYAIGDIQGCFDEFQALLEKINFNPTRDSLWLAGDLVNRGPKSLEVLRFVHALGDAVKIVLGNHDLHLLASWARGGRITENDTLEAVLCASDRDELCHWLRQQKLMLEDVALNFILVHAGILPQWDSAAVRRYAAEVEHALCGENYQELLTNMYSNAENVWEDNLTGLPRLRTLINAFTRLRYCDSQGRMALAEKGALGTQPAGLLPWYGQETRKTKQQRIVFGHWAALDGAILGDYNVFALDTGCVWGKKLRALRLDNLQVIEVPSQQGVYKKS